MHRAANRGGNTSCRPGGLTAAEKALARVRELCSGTNRPTRKRTSRDRAGAAHGGTSATDQGEPATGARCRLPSSRRAAASGAGTIPGDTTGTAATAADVRGAARRCRHSWAGPRRLVRCRLAVTGECSRGGSRYRAEGSTSQLTGTSELMTWYGL